jgi:hypothetical protein
MSRTFSTKEESTSDEGNDDDDAPPPAAPTDEPRPTIEVVADKGYHKVELLFELGRAEYRTYIPVPEQKGQRQFTDKGGMLAREAFHHNRSRVRRDKGKKLLRLPGDRIERTFALACETGAHHRLVSDGVRAGALRAETGVRVHALLCDAFSNDLHD